MRRGTRLHASHGPALNGRPRAVFHTLRREWPLSASVATAALFFVFGKRWLADLSSSVWFAFMLAWLFGAIMVSAFAVVRHAEGLAEQLGEPIGTLVLTLSMSGMEMMMIAAVMYAGHGESSLARDTMLAIVMIVLNGLVGVSLLLGGLRYHEQTYNLYGANAFLAVILPLSVLGLVLPSFTVSSPGPTLSPLQSGFLIITSVGLYSVFLAIQTLLHRDYFVSPGAASSAPASHDAPEVHSARRHSLLLIAYVLPVVFLAKQIAVPIDYGAFWVPRRRSEASWWRCSSCLPNPWPRCVPHWRTAFSVPSTSRWAPRCRASA